LTAMVAGAALAADALAGLLGHEIPWVRVAAMEALGAIGSESVPALIRMLHDGTTPERVRTMLVLAALEDKAAPAAPVLEELFGATDHPLHQRATATLAIIRPKGATVEDASMAKRPALPLEVQPVTMPVAAEASDWPQFHGPLRDAMCRETGLLARWPDEGPPLAWKLEGLGRGYSSIAITDGRLFTMGDRKSDDGSEAQFVVCYDLKSRDALWATRVGPPHGNGGPRCTPTVDGELLYALGTDGDLVCLESATGQERWRKSLVGDFGGKMMSVWKFSESPLIDGERLVCTPGGPDATLAALNKLTGEEIWRCAMPSIGDRGKDGAGYASMVVAEVHGVRQYVQMLGRGAVGVEAATGKFLWGYNRIANDVANIPTPVVRGDRVFVTTSYKTGSALLQINRDGDAWRADEVYFLGPREFENHHGGVVLVGDHIYGGNGQNRGGPTCVRWATGEIAWKIDRGPASGSAAVLYVDGRLIFRFDRGPVALIEATPDEYRLVSMFEPPTDSGPAWSHPVVHAGQLYLRHSDILLCYDLRAQ